MKSKKNLEKFDKKKDTIRMDQFVIHYLNDGVPVDCKKLTHRDLKGFNNPFVVTVSYEFASANIELILTNKILLVVDRYGNIAPYINAIDLKKMGKLETIEEQLDILRKTRINELSQLVKIWSKIQLLNYDKEQIELTMQILRDVNSSKLSELGGNNYVKKYQSR